VALNRGFARRVLLKRTALLAVGGLLGGLTWRRPAAAGTSAGPFSLGTATSATFAGLVGERFRVDRLGRRPIALTLLESSDVRPGCNESAGAPIRSPFSLIFRGPEGDRLVQETYRLRHGRLGTFDLFLVPVGRHQGEARYQAVFG
jgi:hypothetical protein